MLRMQGIVSELYCPSTTLPPLEEQKPEVPQEEAFVFTEHFVQAQETYIPCSVNFVPPQKEKKPISGITLAIALVLVLFLIIVLKQG